VSDEQLETRLRREFPGLLTSELRAFAAVGRNADRAAAALKQETLARVARLHATPPHPDWPRDPACPCATCRDWRETNT
jgi:hypothetical protein